VVPPALPVDALHTYDVIARQRAHRRFREDDVDDALVEHVLTAATFAPSSENLQPWVFVVVRDTERRAAIGAIMREIWTQGGRDYSQGRSGGALFADVDAGIGGGAIAQAPVLVVVAGDTGRVPQQWLKSSIFPAVQNLLLAATSVGLGSALTTIATMRADELASLVDLPPSVVPLAVVPLGWPTKPLGPPRREPFAGRTHREQYGRPWDVTAHEERDELR
jgi:nitroreductase